MNENTTCYSSLNVKGTTTTEGLYVVDSSSYTNQYQSEIVPPSALGNSQIQTLKQFAGFNQVLDLQPAEGKIILSGQTTVKSSFNVIKSSFNVINQ